MGMAILFITHDLGIIAEMADAAVVMYLGNVVEQADIKALFTDPKHPYTQKLPQGCRFHPRCAHFMPGVCDAAMPPLYKTSPSHDARCYLYDGVHGQGQHAAD
jgi:ABC-type dipeptide/oligopeptide/nickel transport system ATPase component